MHYRIIVTAVFLSVVLTSAIAETIPVNQLPQVNSFAIVDTEGEQYIAATNGGLFHSDDHGHNWSVYPGYGLPASLVTTTPQGTVYAFVLTRGLLQLNPKTNQWQEVSNEFGSQMLRQLSTTSWTPSRLVAMNQYGKFIVSSNHGIEWSGISGPYKPATSEQERGRDLYVSKCQSCHGKNGNGENYSMEALTNKEYIMAPALDASAHAWHHTDEALQKTILEGSTRTSRMAAWKNTGVSEGGSQDLVAYIKSLWTQRELDCQGPKHMQCM